ncbi:type I restriction enzyme HsdR N-terminal domain-containing protein [Spiractinospora alimapuensis]|uniref:type I restriction endonuclease n=1 Tax=Spiractinospora alimapuensis TaxID=2820884 RepID=UPI001F418D8E|nr:type I restriction endonuclease [Spiractinospora alimapuensis]QVQ49985.1 type I restriction enzyme HsdR N-terminal domain-containing protein [Spiractinospora alimapuensis]
MEFHERLGAIAAKIRSQRDTIQTEEATKNAFIMPFIAQVLGYDVFDPREVVPEFTADVGVKRNEKVDYAIIHEGEVQILVECKKSTEPLSTEHAGQLFRYFAVTNARIAVLTNGITYEFYTDLDSPNRMDEKPFLIVDLLSLDETLLPELRKLTKEAFDLDSVINAAEQLRFLGSIKRTLAAQFREPEEEWVRFFWKRATDGSLTKRRLEQFTPLVAEAASQFLNDQANERLKAALGAGQSPPADHEGDGETDDTDTGSESHGEDAEGTDSEIVTTLEELEGYRIVKAIAGLEVAPGRITYRDSKSYFAVLVDDNNRKPVARLHFNAKTRRHLGTFDAEKNETRHLISGPEDIYLHSDAIRAAARTFGG